MNFKEDVEFYLGKNRTFNYYGFDIMNDDITEEEEEEEEEEENASTKTDDVCPKCGKKACECKCSCGENKASVPADFGVTPEEIEMIKLIRKNGLGGNFVAETPEEKEMLKLAAKISKTKATVDDKTAGYAPSCKTKTVKESILNLR